MEKNKLRVRGTGITAYEEALIEGDLGEAFDKFNEALEKNGGSFFGLVSQNALAVSEEIIAANRPEYRDPDGVRSRLKSCVVRNAIGDSLCVWKEPHEAIIGKVTAVRDPYTKEEVPGVWTISEIACDDERDTPFEDSPEALAKELVKLIHVAKHDIAQDRADHAARFAFEAGMAWATMTLKWRWDKVVISAQKTQAGRKKKEEGAMQGGSILLHDTCGNTP